MAANKVANAKALKGPDALFKTSDKLEAKGVWLDYGDFRIRITRAGATNQKFKQLFEAKMRPHRRAADNGTLPNDVAERITREVWAQSIVMGWDSPLGDNIIPYNGGNIAFSPEECARLFEELPDLFIDVRDQSMKLGLFVEADAEGDAGN